MPILRILEYFLSKQFFTRIPKIRVKVELIPGVLILHLVENTLVVQLRGTGGVRAFLLDIIDPTQQRICRGFPFIEAAEGFHLSR